MLAGFGLIAFRDPNGIRPIGWATRQGARGGLDYMTASESVVAQGLGFSDWQDIKAGEPAFFVTQCRADFVSGEAVIITRNLSLIHI